MPLPSPIGGEPTSLTVSKLIICPCNLSSPVARSAGLHLCWVPGPSSWAALCWWCGADASGQVQALEEVPSSRLWLHGGEDSSLQPHDLLLRQGVLLPLWGGIQEQGEAWLQVWLTTWWSAVPSVAHRSAEPPKSFRHSPLVVSRAIGGVRAFWHGPLCLLAQQPGRLSRVDKEQGLTNILPVGPQPPWQ